MPKTLGEWLFLAYLALFNLLGAMNQLVATLFLVGSLMAGYHEGFDRATVLASLIFVLLLTSDLASQLLRPENILKSLWLNLFVLSIKLAYLGFAGLLFYGLFWDGSLVKYYWICLVVAIWLTLVNLPQIIFHLALCFPRLRQYMLELNTELDYAVSSKSFREDLEEWERETAFISSPSKQKEHPAYKRIVAMGKIAIPHIINELRQKPSWILIALYDITGEHPSPPHHAGNLNELAKDWINWAEHNGY